MLNVKSFEKDNWKCSFALARMLFDEGELSTLSSKIRDFMNQREGEPANLFPDGNEGAVEQLAKIRDQTPSLPPNLKAHPVLWTRFAFSLQRQGCQLSDRFLECYAKWRKDSSHAYGGSNVCWTAIQGDHKGVTTSCPLDYFLHAPNLGVDVGTSKVSITLKGTFTGLPDQPIRDDPYENHVGPHSLNLIKKYVITAVVNGSIKGLTSNTENGRYICYLSRRELTIALKSKYLKAQRPSTETIFRGIGKFVACSRPKGSLPSLAEDF